MTREELKQAFISIVIGAIVAFLTTFLQGALDFLRGTENNILGGVVAGIKYLSARITHFT